MKRNLLLILACVLTTSIFAQEADLGKLRAGLGLVYATKIENMGINLNGVYSFADQWEGELGYTHIFKKNYVGYNVLDLNAHYICCHPAENLSIYGLGGLAINFLRISDGEKDYYTDTRLGFNLGAGCNYKLTEKLNLVPQLCYTFRDSGYFRIGAGVQYLF